MTDILQIEDEVLEGTDNWNVASVAVPRAGFSSPVQLTQTDISGSIGLAIYSPESSVPVYSTSFSKTLMQDGVTEAVHPALIDSRWGLDDIGHNFCHQIRQTDVGAGVMKGGRRYTMVYTFPTAQDGNVLAIFVWEIQPVH